MTTNTLTHLVRRQAERYSDREAFSFREEGDDSNTVTSWREFSDLVDACACAFEILGIREFDHIGIFSANRPQNIIFDFAAYANRAVPVSIYSTSSRDQVEYIVNDARISLLGVGDQKQYDMAREAMKNCQSLTRLVAFAPVERDADDNSTLSFDELVKLGQHASDDCRATVDARRAAATPDDVATLIYTSGTTGEPKGAILPHSCFDAIIAMHEKRLYYVSDRDRAVCFLPLSHIFEKAWNYFCLHTGIRVFINLDPPVIQDTLRREHPTCMCSVPRFWEKVYNGVQDKLSRVSPIKRLLMRHAIAIGRKRNIDYVRVGRKVPRWLERRYLFYYKQIFKPMLKVVGVDKGRMFPTAGAPLSRHITEYLIACGVPIVIGYGLSETTATVSCYLHRNYKIGTVGTPLEGLEVKIGPDNEIMVKGPTVMRGYHNKPEATAEALTPDGWLRTGDAGYIDADGKLVLTERIKDLFKTSNGKYIAPQVLETRLSEDRYIEQAAIIGDQRKFVTAIIIPAFSKIKEYAQRKGIKFDSMEQLVENPQIRRLIEHRVNLVQRGLANFEKIKRFVLLPKEFTIDSGELTNTLKLRRPIINSHYASQIEAMYTGA